MRLTVLGGCGAWPTAEQACSGYLLESDGFRLLIDPGYATFPRLLPHRRPDEIDAVLVSHGHPDHCADLNPLLRARALSEIPAPPLPVYAPPGALDAVLALDRPGMLTAAYVEYHLRAGRGREFGLGPFTVGSVSLPHHVPNVGFRLTVGSATEGSSGAVLAYTGDTGPSPEVGRLADRADVLLAEATYPVTVPRADEPYLLSARLAGRYATTAGAGRLVLTHLWPGSTPSEAVAAAEAGYGGPVEVASPDLRLSL